MILLAMFLLTLSVNALCGQEAQIQIPQKPLEISQEDLNYYLDFVRDHNPSFARQENFHALARNGFDRVYVHQMRSGFYLKPSPRRVIKQIKLIFRELDTARLTLRQLRGDNAAPVSRKEMTKIMDQFDRSARTMQSEFQEYFNELNHGPVSIQIPQLPDPDQQWKFYLVRIDQCFGMLAEQLEQYFFRTEPGRVDVQDYQSPGIVTMTKALRELTRVYRGKLGI